MDTHQSELSSPSCVPAVIHQHTEDAACLHAIRTRLTAASHVKLRDLGRFDDRVASHLDGLSVAGEQGWPIVDAALTNPLPGVVFTAAIGAIEAKSVERLNRLYALAEAVPEAQPGLVSAFGWVEQERLRGIVNGLLASPNSFLRLLGIAACAVHRVHPGKARDLALESAASALRARALRASGELGRRDLMATCLGMLAARDAESGFWSAWSAVLLGNRSTGLESLKAIGEVQGGFQARAFSLSLQALDQQEAQAWLRQLARNPENLRWLIQGSGIAGDAGYVPWLLDHMKSKATARLAGRSFSLITGLNLAYLNLGHKSVENTVSGPNDDPEDANVDADEDGGLPWPDPARVANWWRANGGRFSPGTRYFLGAPLTRENCLRVLKEGFQSQRILAAHYLCLLEPGTQLFEWRAPAFRQQRLLATIT